MKGHIDKFIVFMLKSKVMKQRSTTPVSKRLVTKSIVVATAVMMVLAAPLAMMPTAKADKYDDQIRALQSEIDQFQAEAGKLSQKANSLQAEIAKLNAEKAVIQRKIDLNQAKYDQLQQQIQETKQKISDNKDALGVTIADMYIGDSISPLEMLASSQNIGDYVDKQTYRSSISEELQKKIDEINELKEKLNKQKIAVERNLTDQKNSRKALVAKENERNGLLAQTRGQESTFKKLSAQKEAEKRQVQEQQQAAIAAAMSRAGGGGSLSGGGSLASYASWVGGCNFNSVTAVSYNNDSLGYGCNQCVSYAAYMMMVKTGYAPSYWGNANMWPGSAAGTKFKVSHTPRENSLGVISAGQYGHIVYVHNYNRAANTVDISQYNEWLPGKGYGYYSTRSGVSASTYDTYIYL